MASETYLIYLSNGLVYNGFHKHELAALLAERGWSEFTFKATQKTLSIISIKTTEVPFGITPFLFN